MILIQVLFFYFQYKADLIEQFSKTALPHFSNGRLKPIIHSVYSLEEIQAAHEAVEKNLNIGKIIIQVVNNTEKTKSEL